MERVESIVHVALHSILDNSFASTVSKKIT